MHMPMTGAIEQLFLKRAAFVTPSVRRDTSESAITTPSQLMQHMYLQVLESTAPQDIRRFDI